MILLDTQVVVWLAQDPGFLSESATTAIQEARHQGGLAIAGRTLWELAMLVSRNKVELDVSIFEFLADVERLFVVLPMTARIAEKSVRFSDSYPKDPSDRVIGATALVHGFRLITADEAIRRSGEVPCLW
jgi:PIN domain nuclease of toxin-antitoxin system